jgi:hypothetical protein
VLSLRFSPFSYRDFHMKYSSIMDLYSDFLTGSPNSVSATVLSDVIHAVYSHDSITRMLSQPILDQKIYWQSIKKSVRQIEKADGVISIDDTFSEKPHSDENELIGWYFDHTQGRTIKAINILTFTYANPDFALPVKLPVAFELVQKTVLTSKQRIKKAKLRLKQCLVPLFLRMN